MTPLFDMFRRACRTTDKGDFNPKLLPLAQVCSFALLRLRFVPLRNFFQPVNFNLSLAPLIEGGGNNSFTSNYIAHLDNMALNYFGGSFLKSQPFAVTFAFVKGLMGSIKNNAIQTAALMRAKNQGIITHSTGKLNFSNNNLNLSSAEIGELISVRSKLPLEVKVKLMQLAVRKSFG